MPGRLRIVSEYRAGFAMTGGCQPDFCHSLYPVTTLLKVLFLMFNHAVDNRSQRSLVSATKLYPVSKRVSARLKLMGSDAVCRLQAGSVDVFRRI